MRCPTCGGEALKAADEEHGQAAWWLCPAGSCTQVPWQESGMRGHPGERAPLVDQLVGLNAEALEQGSDWQGRTAG
jgi:hypothetical protein